MQPKKQLIRVVKNNEGQISLDPTGKKPGRGAYICRQKECIELCLKHKAFNKAFEMNVGDQVYNQIKEELEKLGESE